MLRKATFSEDKKHRYVLWRLWDSSKPYAMAIGLNPSKDDSERDDHTIRILRDRLQSLGYGGFAMCNLFTIISSDPNILLNPIVDAEGPADMWLETTAHTVQDVIFCWGIFSEAKERASKVIKMFPDAKCFGKAKDGSPWHPRALHYKGITSDKVSLVKYDGTVMPF